MNNIDKRRENFIEKAKIIHKNENIDYSKVVYINNRTPVLLIDNDIQPNGEPYGEYWQTPSNHLKGQSHPNKRGKKIALKNTFKTEEIIKRFKEVHKGENLDYSYVNYINMHTKVKIIDNDIQPNGEPYGEYWQDPKSHLKGCGHPLKGRNKTIIKNSLTSNEFIIKGKTIHGEDKYVYSNVNYINNKTKVEIFCKKHGNFLISPDNFLQGKGCPKCGNHLSYAEDELYDMISKHYLVERNNRSILNGLELDLFIPELNIAIEYNGLRWHGENFGKDKNYHINKLLKAKEKNIKLIQIFEDEFILNKDIVLNKIKHLCEINEKKMKVSARNCKIKEITKFEARDFLNKNHIQGYIPSTFYLGAFLEHKLIGVMSFTKKENEWILDRFASDYDYICRGIGGKLFKYFVKNNKPTIVKSFADRRWTINDENLYTKLGFKLDYFTKPDYRYYNFKLFGNKRIHKFSMRKKILHEKYGFPLTMTENEMTKELGCDRIWDCGLIKYVWKEKRD